MNSGIRCIIVEDEEPARNLLKSFLAGFQDIELVAECADGFCGVKAINELKPDLVFLDIQMPRLTGFEVLDLIEYHPRIIFTTAYDQFALKAFEHNAADYLLKPFSLERFTVAVGKVLSTTEAGAKDVQEQLLKYLPQAKEFASRVAIRTGNRIHVIATDQIHYIEADGGYTNIFTAKESLLKEKPLRFFEDLLDPAKFVRIHRSCMVNVEEIQRLDYYDKESYSVVLKNGKTLKASITGYRQLKQLLNL
jgi:two-component system LytT family response regulator